MPAGKSGRLYDIGANRREVRSLIERINFLRKLALCGVFWYFLYKTLMNQARALVHVYTDGVSLYHGAVEMGQGVNTKMIKWLNLLR